MKRDISFDLETLATTPDAYILSIGACKFDIESGSILDTLYIPVICGKDRHIDVSIVMWWLEQPEDPRSKVTNDFTKSISLIDALIKIYGFVENDDRVWGNGATFDISILEDAYYRSDPKIHCPWKFYNVRDVRTILDIAVVNGFDKSSVPREGEKHNALDDAIYQAMLVIESYKFLKR